MAFKVGDCVCFWIHVPSEDNVLEGLCIGTKVGDEVIFTLTCLGGTEVICNSLFCQIFPDPLVVDLSLGVICALVDFAAVAVLSVAVEAGSDHLLCNGLVRNLDSSLLCLFCESFMN